jgi:hypothetical protein
MLFFERDFGIKSPNHDGRSSTCFKLVIFYLKFFADVFDGYPSERKSGEAVDASAEVLIRVMQSIIGSFRVRQVLLIF